MAPPSTISCNDDVGRFVTHAEDMVVGSYDVLQRTGKRVLGGSGKAIARCDDYALASVTRLRGGGAEQLDEQVDVRFVGGVASDVSPAMDVEDDVRSATSDPD